MQPAFQPVPGELAPGGELDVQLHRRRRRSCSSTRTASTRCCSTSTARSTATSQRRVGELSTYVVQQPVAADRADGRRLAVAAGRAHPPRRLRRLRRRRPRRRRSAPAAGWTGPWPCSSGCPDAAAGRTRAGPALPVTLAVDPALVEELDDHGRRPLRGRRRRRRRARAPRRPRRSSSGCAPSPPSTRWSRCRYGDVDADALHAVGLADVLTRSLPGHAGGHRARTRPGSAATATAAGTSAPPAAPGRRRRRRRQSEVGAGAAILAEALDVEPRTDLAWAAGRLAARPTRSATLQAGGVRAGRARPGRPDRRATRRSAWPGTRGRRTDRGRRTPAGTLDALVADADARRRRRRRRADRPAARGWPSSATSPSWPCSAMQAPGGYGADRAGRAAARASRPGPRAPAR